MGVSHVLGDISGHPDDPPQPKPCGPAFWSPLWTQYCPRSTEHPPIPTDPQCLHASVRHFPQELMGSPQFHAVGGWWTQFPSIQGHCFLSTLGEEWVGHPIHPMLPVEFMI